MQRYEIEAWLGDDHGLTEEQFETFTQIAQDVEARYPGPDDADDAQEALTVAHRLLVDDSEVLDELHQELLAARVAESRVLAAIQQAAMQLIPSKQETEAGFARRVGVDRMTVRGWLGKR